MVLYLLDSKHTTFLYRHCWLSGINIRLPAVVALSIVGSNPTQLFMQNFIQLLIIYAIN